MTIDAATWELIAAGVRGRSLLFVTSGGDAAETRFAVDPVIAEALERAGARVNQTTYDRLDENTAARHDVVILGAFPKTDAPELVREVLSGVFPSVLRAVSGGTGLLMMVDDHYSRIFGPLNEALGPLGIEVLCEDVHDSDAARNGRIPTSPEIATLVVDAACGNHPALAGVRRVLLPNGWQSGAWPLIASDDAWEPLLTGSETSVARVLRHSEEGRGGRRPMLAASRHHGAGRIALLPAHSTFFFGNGMHPRWDGGLFLAGNDNARFLGGLLGWLASARPARTLANRVSLTGGGVMPWFTQVPAAEQPIIGEPRRGLVAVAPRMDGSGNGVGELAVAAREAGFSWAVFAPREEELGDDGWKALVEACAKNSDESFLALPAVDFRVDQDFGARGLAVMPEFWPPRGTNRRFVIQMIEEGGGWQIFSAPWASPVPAWNIGGFQGMEICGYAGPGQEMCGRAEDIFLRLQSHDWFLSPVARFHARNADEIRAAAGKEATCVIAGSIPEIADKIPRVGHCEFSEVFVSGGPQLREFWMEGPGMTRDVWEGRYYTWSGDPGETAVLHIAVTSREPLQEVVLWESGRVLARFLPDGGEFSTEYILPNPRCSRSYWLTASDKAGGRMTGMARRTKSGLFRTHGGGDRMNTYGSVVVPSDAGEFELRGKRCSTSATLLFGLGWRQHQLNIYPPVPAVDYHPEGGEWGAPHGRLERIYLNPVALTKDGPVGDRPLEDRAGFDFTSDEAALLTEAITIDEQLPPATHSTAVDVHLEKFSPEGGRVGELREFRAEGKYLFGRWLPEGGPVVARFERELTFLHTLKPVPQGGIALRLLRMQADSGDFLHSVFVSGSDHPPGVKPVDDLAEGVSLGDHAVAGIFPQPYGAFGFLQLEGPPLVVRTTRSNGVIALEAGLPMPSGGEWKAGDVVRVVLLLLVSGKGNDGAPLFRDLRDLIDSPVNERCQITVGRCTAGGYPVVIEAAGGTASWTMAGRTGADRMPCLVEVRGFGNGDAVWAHERGSRAWRPLALHDGNAYLTVPEDWSDIVVGTPILVDGAGLQSKLWPSGNGWHFALHNNTEQPVPAKWRSNPLFPWTRQHAGGQMIQPGQEWHEFLEDCA